MNNPNLRILANSVLFLLLQVVLVRNLVLFETAFPFIYLAALLVVPVDFNKVTLLFIAFFLGLVMDSFYDTYGIHAAACVLLAFARPFVIDALTPRMGYENNEQASWQAQGLPWFATYAFILIFIHHLLIFFVEVFSLDYFWTTFARALASAMYTLVILLLTQMISSPSKKEW